MAFVVIYDGCVLFPFHQRDLLIRLAQTDLVQAKWTDRILDECFRAIAEQRPDLDPERLARTRDLMNAAVRDVRVDGYQSLEQSIEFPDQDDRHVVAAAIKAHAQVIVTNNLQDFPAPTLEPTAWKPKVLMSSPAICSISMRAVSSRSSMTWLLR